MHWIRVPKWTQLSPDTGTIASTYDALNRPTKQSFAGGADITITYDQGNKAVGHLSRIIDREGTVAFAYDQQGRVSQETREIGVAGNTIGYTWDPATGDLAGMTYPSGLALSYSRDAAGGITDISLAMRPWSPPSPVCLSDR